MITTKHLLDELTNSVRNNLLEFAELRELSPQLFVIRLNESTWNMTELIEHLNTYNAWYLPRISAAMQQSLAQPAPTFKAGWLGNYFVDMMRPGPKKYKAAAPHRPAAGLDHQQVFASYWNEQQQLLNLLEAARNYNLNDIRITISILPLLTLKLGDVFRFLITHQQRHFLQIYNLLTAIKRQPAI